MKIRSVKANNHKRAFEVATWRDRLLFPFSRALPEPSTDDPVESTRVDEDSGWARGLGPAGQPRAAGVSRAPIRWP